MVPKFYTASKSRNQGRDSWSVILRHPARYDANTGKPGRRIRRGLGTPDEVEANRLVDQLNEILRTPDWWEPAARALAADRFDARVVEIFYEGAESTRLDFRSVRDEHLPLPTPEDGYRRVLLLGTTGAGKTTVVRQLLGTDPVTERFPSTSTAKTTVADTELIVSDDTIHRAVVTFVPRDEIVDYLTENVIEASLAVHAGRPDTDVVRRLLDHVNQRFRFSYVLGRGASTADEVDDDVVDDDELLDVDLDFLESEAVVDVAKTAEVINDSVARLRDVVETYTNELRDDLDPADGDERVAEELIEEALESELRRSEAFHTIVDRLSDEIEQRFSALTAGEIRRNRQGWPISWSYEEADRKVFIRTLSRFTSNYAPLFGQLLTPLVNGIRVSGPFSPAWDAEPRKLVLIDGEGLGHTPTSASALSTHVAELLQQVEAVLLVDNAAQPMQAAPTAALKGIAVSGNTSKLHFLFSHFDQVKGDNLRTFSAREEHVLASVENVLKAIGEDLGPASERALRARLDAARFFVGGIQNTLTPDKQSGKRTINQLDALIETLSTDPERQEAALGRPVYDRMNLSLAVTAAAQDFHAKWRGLLGLSVNPAAPKEHWARVKALSRRLAEGWNDEYDDLKPVADLRYALQRQVLLMLQQPLRWDGGEPVDVDKQVVIDSICIAVTQRLLALTKNRIAEETKPAWQDAYARRGPGSTFVRAQIIARDVCDRGAPVPGVAASPDQNRFLHSVADLISEVAEETALTLD